MNNENRKKYEDKKKTIHKIISRNIFSIKNQVQVIQLSHRRETQEIKQKTFWLFNLIVFFYFLFFFFWSKHQKIKIIEKHVFERKSQTCWGCGSSSVGGGSGRFFVFVIGLAACAMWYFEGAPKLGKKLSSWRSSLAGAARTNQLFAVLGLMYAADRIAALAVSLLRVHACKPLPKVVLIVLLVDQRFKKCLPEPLPQFLFFEGYLERRL